MLAYDFGLTASPLAHSPFPGKSVNNLLKPSESLEMKPLKTQHCVASLENVGNKIDAALRRLVSANLVAVLFTDLAGNILSADDSFLNLLDYSSGDLPASIRELTPPEHQRLDEEALEKLMAFGACAPFEKTLIKSDGTAIPV